jgi:hypothetical protein
VLATNGLLLAASVAASRVSAAGAGHPWPSSWCC